MIIIGIFGDLDASEVSDNPFYVAPDIYETMLSEFDIKKSNKTDLHGLAVKFDIEDEDSEYNGSNVGNWITLYMDDADEARAKDSNAIKRDRANLKSLLTELGLSEEEMNNLVITEEGIHILNPEIVANYLGEKYAVEVTESKDKVDETKVWTNIKKVTKLNAA